MKVVVDFIKSMATSDLRQIAIKDVGTGNVSIDTVEQISNMNTLLTFVNQGLLELHKRFPLRVLSYESDITTYATPAAGIYDQGTITLPNDAFSVVDVTTNTYDPVLIDDRQIEYLFQQGAFHKLFLRTVAVNTFVVSGDNEDKVTSLLFTYTAAPTTVTLKSELPLPVSYMEAFQNYVAYRGYSSVKSVTTVGDEGMTYLKKFEANCNELKNMTSTMDDYNSFDSTRLYKKCFV